MRQSYVLSKQLKLLALPLARSAPTVSSHQFYLHAKKNTLPQTVQGRQGVVSWAINKAADKWAELGTSPEKTFKKRIFDTGERFMDRIDYEEWSLKSIDPAIAPKPWSVLAREKSPDPNEPHPNRVDLVYPKAFLSQEEITSTLKSQLSTRGPHHKSGMFKCLAATPLTAPFALVPIIPNFPLFYLLWRAWSHYRAWKSSVYLQELLSTSQVRFVSSNALDQVYNQCGKAQQILLTKDTVNEIVKIFSLSNEEEAQLDRATLQAEARRIKAKSN